jgi:RNA polymerase sigma factor (TIGR02999 family)
MALPVPPERARAVTHLLSRVRGGDAAASGELMGEVYAELRAVAGAVFSGRGAGHTLQPTALVHEAWFKLRGNLDSIEDRRHFLVVAGKAMRQVVADHARARNTQKRGGERGRVTLDTGLARSDGDMGVDLVDLDDCLTRLAERNPRHAEVAELRLLGGLASDEVAAALGVSPRSIDSDWAMAKAWLQRELAGSR